MICAKEGLIKLDSLKGEYYPRSGSGNNRCSGLGSGYTYGETYYSGDFCGTGFGLAESGAGTFQLFGNGYGSTIGKGYGDKNDTGKG